MVRDSKQSLSIANVSALTLLYTGTGTATAALAANTLTIARANVHAFNLKYTGTGTCNAYVDSEDGFCYYREGVTAFALQFTGEGDCTVTIAANVLTITRGEVPTAYDLTDPLYDTLTELVAVLNAVEDLTCTIGDDALGTEASIKLSAIEATDITSELELTYDETEIQYDLANALYDTVGELVAVLNAVAYFTCTRNTACAANTNTNLLDTYEELEDTEYELTSAGVNVTYTPADATYDLTNAARNLLSELIAELDAISDLTCTAVTTHTGNASIQLVAFEAASINTALTMTMNYASLTATFNDIGDAIGVQGWDSLALYVKVDINSSQNARLKFLAKTEVDDTDLFLMDHNRMKCPYATIPATEDYIELDSDADQLVEVVIPDLYGIAAVQVQVSAGTVGETAGAITAIEYFRTKEG